MLEANKSKLFEKLFYVYNTNLLKRRFHSFNVKGLKHLRQRQTSLPLIIYANHSSWWDGLAAFQISYKTKLDSFVMMEEKQLKRFFLFRKLGAFSIVRENPRLAMQSINYAVDLLKNSDRTLWIFPQGEILPNDLRPLHFYRGLSKIIKKLGKCATVSLTFRYEFFNEFKPEIFANIKSPQEISFENSKKLTAHFENKTVENLEEIKKDILNQQFDEYERIV
ncbi:MAG: lysophospholipid acyltransferase family protein [Aridibacter sp.]